MTEDENLAFMQRLAAARPGIVPRLDGWEGAVGLVTESEYKRITAQARREGRWYMAQGPYLDCWFVWLGDLPKASRPTCGAKTRKGTPCQCRAIEGKKRCKFHGGASTGPKTEEGRARIAQSNRRRAKNLSANQAEML